LSQPRSQPRLPQPRTRQPTSSKLRTHGKFDTSLLRKPIRTIPLQIKHYIPKMAFFKGAGILLEIRPRTAVPSTGQRTSDPKPPLDCLRPVAPSALSVKLGRLQAIRSVFLPNRQQRSGATGRRLRQHLDHFRVTVINYRSGLRSPLAEEGNRGNYPQHASTDDGDPDPDLTAGHKCQADCYSVDRPQAEIHSSIHKLLLWRDVSRLAIFQQDFWPRKADAAAQPSNPQRR
jgi:hypothetical protein